MNHSFDWSEATMSSQPKVQEVTQRILEAFESGALPAALAQTFLMLPDSPCARWSITNRMIVALRGYGDARGFRQWQAVGRSVRKGERAFYIFGPLMVKAKKADPRRGIEVGDMVCIGFTALPVFGYEQTEGEPLAHEREHRSFIDELPLLSVARSWGLDVGTSARPGTLGTYRPGQRIDLAVHNLSTWAHELVHAADDRLGSLDLGERINGEIVAELGSAVLLECLGRTEESDRGGAYEYLQRQCALDGRDLLSACIALVERVHACVQLLLDTAREVEESVDVEPSEGLDLTSTVPPPHAQLALFTVMLPHQN
jgi:antirestriction protein ArdC